MKLTKHGTIEIDGHLARFTPNNGWMVSRLGRILGYVDILDEVQPLIAKNLERVRSHLAMVTQQAQERKEEEAAELAMINGSTKK